VWDLASGEHLHTLDHADHVYGLAISADGLLAAAGVDPTVRLWNPATGQQDSFPTGHNGPIWCVAFSADG
jgi:WD40 repeat protein